MEPEIHRNALKHLDGEEVPLPGRTWSSAYSGRATTSRRAGSA